MGAEHDDFIFLVGTGNFGDGVVLHGIVIVESIDDVQFERDVLFFLQKACDAAPVLGGHRELGNCGRLAGFVGASGLDEHGAAAGGAAAVVDDRKNFFVGEELVHVFDQLPALGKLGHARGRTFAGNLVFGGLGQLIVAENFVGASVIGFTSASGPKITIIPASLPRY